MRAPRRPRHARRELRDVGRTEREGRPTRSRRASLPGFQLGADRQPGLDLGQLFLGLRVLEVAANVLLLELLLALAVEVVGDGVGHVLAAVHPPLLAVLLEALEQLLGQADGELASGHTGLLPKYYQDDRAWDRWQAKSRTRAGPSRPGPARLWTTEPGRRPWVTNGGRWAPGTGPCPVAGGDVVDDRVRVVGAEADAGLLQVGGGGPPGGEDGRWIERRQLGDPAADVVAVGVELLRLGDGVEDPVEEGGIGAGPGDPLPAAVVGGEVPVHQVLEEEAGTLAPVDQQVLGQERGHHHAGPVVDPALAGELAHAGVDQWVAGATLPPGGQAVRVVLELEAGELAARVLPGALRLVVEDIAVEVSPEQLVDEGLAVPGPAGVLGGTAPTADRGRDLARGDQPEAQIRAESRGAVAGHGVPRPPVPVDPPLREPAQPLQRQRGVRREDPDSTVHPESGPSPFAGPPPTRGTQVAGDPDAAGCRERVVPGGGLGGAGEGGVDAERVAVARAELVEVAQVDAGHRVQGAAVAAQRLLHRGVPAAGVRGVLA